MAHATELGGWARALLGQFESLSPVDGEGLAASLEGLTPPCQVDAVWFALPELGIDCQVFLFSHFADLEHGTIAVHGPAHPSEAAQILDKLTTSAKWNRKVTGRVMFALKDPTYARLLEIPVGQALVDLRGLVSARVRPGGTAPGTSWQADGRRILLGLHR